MSAPNASDQVTRYTEQYMQNYGFDDLNKLPVVEIVGVDANGAIRRLAINTSGGLVSEVGTSPVSGQKTQSGIAVALVATSTPVKNGVIVQALAGNSAKIYVGDSGVTTGTGFELQAGQATSIAIANLSAVYIVGTSGDGVCYIASN